MASTRISVSKLALVGLTHPLAMLVRVIVGATMLLPHPLLGPHFAAKVLAASLVPGIVSMILGARLVSARTLAMKLAGEILPIVWIAAYFATPTRAIEVATGVWFLVTAARELRSLFTTGARLASTQPAWVEQTMASGELSLGLNAPCACRSCRARDEAFHALADATELDDAAVATAARAYCVAAHRASTTHDDGRMLLE